MSQLLEPIKARVPSIAFPPHAATQPRVALMAEPGLAYISGTLGTWLNRSIAVPLCLTHPDRELGYVLEDSGASAVLTTKPHLDRMRRLAKPFGAKVIELEDSELYKHDLDVENRATSLLSNLQPEDGALIIYTSGTTGSPKGAVHTHKSLNAQIQAINSAWEISSSDTILHALPLHHIHGIVNALYCPLAAGGTVTMLPKFSPTAVWNTLSNTANNNTSTPMITVFMGVPTMYSFLLNAYHSASEAEQKQYKTAINNLRLTVSGSSACPTPIMHAWSELTSGKLELLERYGMTETGMILGNPLHRERKAGTVGIPFPGIDVRIDPATGELAVRGDQLFAGYWQKPDVTEKSFDNKDGYFLTGDTAEKEHLGGYYRLLGRTSVDIIKHGGYKISALEIESVLLGHPRIAECAVVGLPDQQYGEIVAVIASLEKIPLDTGSDSDENKQGLSLDQLLDYAREHLAPYQLPRILHLVPQLPRNAMGKVNKKTLRAAVFPDLLPPAGPSSSSSLPSRAE